MNIKTKIIEKFIDEYKSQQSTYKEYGKIVSKIIRTILKNNEFSYQVVSYRSKGINLLQKKLLKIKNIKN